MRAKTRKKDGRVHRYWRVVESRSAADDRVLQRQTLTRDELLLKLGAARKEAGRVFALVAIGVLDPDQEFTAQTFTFALRKDKLRSVRRREGSIPELTEKVWVHALQRHGRRLRRNQRRSTAPHSGQTT